MIEMMLEYYKDKKILIFGGLGMIGSTIANKLVKMGAKVTIADSRIVPYGANIFNIKLILNSVKLRNIDIRDRDKLASVIDDNEIVFCLAGQVSHNDSIRDPFLDADINYIGHLNILETVKNVNRKIKLVYSGTRLQYGRIEENPVNENHPQKPLTPYSLNKSAAENLYLFYNRVYGIPVISLRISNPYGPRGQMKHYKYGIVNWFIRQAMEGNDINIYGSGEQLRDYIYIDDLVDLFVKVAMTPKAEGNVFNSGSGIGVPFKNMVKTVINIVKSGHINYIPWPEDYVHIETGDYVSDISKIKSVINWKPKVDIVEGIKKTFIYYEKYLENYI